MSRHLDYDGPIPYRGSRLRATPAIKAMGRKRSGRIVTAPPNTDNVLHPDAQENILEGVRRARQLRETEQGLPVTCWCERTVVRVAVDDVVIGLTRACHRPACRRLEDQAVTAALEGQ